MDRERLGSCLAEETGRPLLRGMGELHLEVAVSRLASEHRVSARAAAPYPLPERLGRVTYTDTWLWDKSGRFQLDTLTEGQD